MLTLVLDPGHGGADDDGKVVGDVREDVLALQIAERVEQALTGLPIVCEFTRVEDEYVSLHGRAQLAQKFGADLVVSIHLNSHELGTIHGADLFHLPGDQSAGKIADAIARAMPVKLFSGRVWATAPLPDWRGRAHNVLTPHQALHGKPTVLVECCYLSSSPDRAYVLTEWGKASIANAIVAGVCKFGEMREAA